MRKEQESELEMAARHVAEAQRIISHQRLRIGKLRAAGVSTFDAEQTLGIFESTLKIFEDHERSLRSAREEAKSQSQCPLPVTTHKTQVVLE